MYSILVGSEDVQQEVALKKLQGIPRPSAQLIAKNLRQKAYPNVQGLAAHLPPARPAWLEAQEELVEWSMEKSFAIQECIEAFLENPEEQLESTLQQLESLGVPLHTVRAKASERKKVSYTQMMRNRLPATKEELIEEMSQFPIQRPAASVRQFIRSHSDQIKEENGVLIWQD